MLRNSIVSPLLNVRFRIGACGTHTCAEHVAFRVAEWLRITSM
jgi:hypothetical protein